MGPVARARVIYAKETDRRRDTADTVYAKQINAAWIEAAEVYAHEAKIGGRH